MSRSRIARPVFDGAPTDQLEPVDVYTVHDAEKRNNYTSKVPSAYSRDLEGSLAGNNADLGRNRDRREGNYLPPDRARENLLRSLKGARASIDNLPMEDQIRAVETIMEEYKEHSAMIDSAHGTTRVHSRDLDSATGIADLLHDLTGTSLFRTTNLAVVGAVIGTALTKVSSWGMPRLIDDILAVVRDDRTRKRIVADRAADIVDAGDIDAIETLINKVGAATLVSKTPDIASRVLQRYQFKEGITPADYPTRLEQLVRVLDALQPNWFLVYRGTERVWNLTFISVASDDARMLFLNSDVHRDAILIAPHYPQLPTHHLIFDLYPNIAIERR